MLASELIAELEKKKEIHGDFPVCHWDDWAEFSVEEVNFIDTRQEIGSEYIDGYENGYFLLGKDDHGFGKRIYK